MKRILKKYFPDLLILTGIAVFSYNLLESPSDSFVIELYPDYSAEYQVLGILLFVIGIDIAIRRYFKK